MRAVGEASDDSVHIERGDPGELTVIGMDPARLGHLAHHAGIELHQLTPTRDDLEPIFFTLTRPTEEPAHHA